MLVLLPSCPQDLEQFTFLEQQGTKLLHPSDHTDACMKREVK